MSIHWHSDDTPIGAPTAFAQGARIITGAFADPGALRALPPPPAPEGTSGVERPLLFLDFEASSLSPGSWPIEIGYAWIAGDRVETRSALIAPRMDWALSDWSERAAEVHGIRFSEVLAGRPAEEIAGETEAFAGYAVVSDNPAREQMWLDRLRAGRAARIEVGALRRAVSARLSDRAADALALRLLRNAAPHRAGPDAARLANAWFDAERDFGRAAA